MATICPKCSHERLVTDEAPDWQCPNCGVAYAKAAKTLPTAPRSTELPATGRLSGSRSSYLLVSFVSLVVGFFAGREYLKYELSQAFKSAATGFSSALQSPKSSNAASASLPPPVAKPREPEPINVALVSKGFAEHNYQAGIGDDQVTFTLRFQNTTGQQIRAFDGAAIFTDLLDNVVKSLHIAVEDPIAASTTIDWQGAMKYNQFIDSDQRLRNAEQQNLKVRFVTKKVLFADGSTKQFDDPQ